jgi:hypothetical protein
VRTSLVIGVAVILMFTGVIPSNSCSCISLTLPEHWHATDVIFSGTVIDVFEAAQAPDSLGRVIVSTSDPIGYTVVVKDIYKGVPADTVMVWTARESSACGYEFSLNGTYLIYAYPRSEDQGLSTSLCTATKPLAAAAEDLAWFAQNPQR